MKLKDISTAGLLDIEELFAEQQYTEDPNCKDWDLKGRFTKNCKHCDQQHQVFTQRGIMVPTNLHADEHDPEYWAKVSIICPCEGVVTFAVPVN